MGDRRRRRRRGRNRDAEELAGENGFDEPFVPNAWRAQAFRRSNPRRVWLLAALRDEEIETSVGLRIRLERARGAGEATKSLTNPSLPVMAVVTSRKSLREHARCRSRGLPSASRGSSTSRIRRSSAHASIQEGLAKRAGGDADKHFIVRPIFGVTTTIELTDTSGDGSSSTVPPCARMVSLSAPLDFPTPERRKCRDEILGTRAAAGLVCFVAVLMRLDVDAFVAGVFAMGIFDVGVFDAGVFEIAAGVRPLVRLDVVLAEVVTESTDDFFERPLPRGQIPLGVL